MVNRAAYRRVHVSFIPGILENQQIKVRSLTTQGLQGTKQPRELPLGDLNSATIRRAPLFVLHSLPTTLPP